MMSTKQKTISIAKEFYDAPAGRFPEDGKYNGQRFREEFLIPALKSFDTVLIDMDESEGYGSSFLEESFGGLVRLAGFAASDLRKKLKLKSDEDESYIQEVWEYIENAHPKKQHSR